MNIFIGIGRLTKEPYISISPTGTKVARYTLAINRQKDKNGNQDADFPSCVAFKGDADFVEKYLHKGTKIGIWATVHTGSYEKNGQTIYTTEMWVWRHYFVESSQKNDNNASTTNIYGMPLNNQPTYNNPDLSTAFTPINNDAGDLPF